MIIIHRQVNTVIQESHINSHIILGSRLPAQVIGNRASPVHFGKAAVDSPAKRIVCHIKHWQRTITSDTLVTRFTITQAQLQVTEYPQIFDKLLFRHTPCNSSRKETSPLVLIGKLTRTVSTTGCSKDIFIHESVIDTCQE